MPQEVLSVTQINEYIRHKMDTDAFLNNVAVRGEISNYKLYPSGHHYFTIKDESGNPVYKHHDYTLDGHIAAAEKYADAIADTCAKYNIDGYALLAK